MSTVPEIKSDPIYQLLRTEKIAEFNERTAQGESCDLRSSDFRGIDLRGLNASGLDLRDCYFRQADLRGIDFREALMEGSNIAGAKISGAYFPPELSADELTLSLLHGTRMRYC
ncbi:Pentapeptide repeat family protein [hydrothermal vent metagenome]|uniref:Pentapeptide repeat family protein n=1 Tax=hydrothermal vent metagenome TaxID=652676 RepID=A0A3B1B8K1_9ZZZZ